MNAVRTAVAITVGTILASIAAVALYGFPPKDNIDTPDVIMVLGPPTPNRMKMEMKLRDDYPSADSLISVSAPGGDFAAEDLNGRCQDSGVTCLTPEPFTTKGETALLRNFLKDRTEAKVVVITFTPHVARTRYIFAKCLETPVTVVGVDEDMSVSEWIHQVSYQSAAFVKAWWTGCP
jgi:hypothetical protein